MSLFIEPADIAKCSGKRVSLDTETNGLYWWDNHIIGVCVHCEDADVYGYLPTLDSNDRKIAKAVVRELAHDTTVIMHNAKFDLHFLDIDPHEVGWRIMDTTVMAHLIDSRKKKALAKVEQRFLGSESKRKHVTEAPARTKIWNWSIGVVADYGYNDSKVTYQLAETMYPILKELGLIKLFWKDMDYLKDLWRIERHGMICDEMFLRGAIELQNETVSDLEQRLWDSCGYEFNWRSHQQLSKAIYENLGIEKPKNPFAGSDGVDRSRFADAGLYKSTCTASFLLTEKTNHPLGTLISALRESYRMASTMKKYIELQDDEHRIHSNFNLTGTRTGRLSSSKPNLQNVPSEIRGRFTQSIYTGDTSRTEEYNLRNAFLARPGKSLVAVDWKQMEMRMFGILSKDPFMLDSLGAGRDIHADIAERVWNTRDKVHREWSKTISFGLIYGMTIGSIMFKLDMTKTEAARVCDQYWAEFPRIKPWLEETIDTCKAFGYIRYWSGRLWREDEPRDMYKGGNAQIQGGCADVLSVAELRVGEWLRSQGDNFNVVNLVHDEIIAEVPDEATEYTAKNMMQIMEVPDLFEIPFYTDAKIGKAYGSLEKVSLN